MNKINGRKALVIVAVIGTILHTALLQINAFGQANNGALPKTVFESLSGYQEATQKLSSETRIPLHLPTFVPRYWDEKNPLFAILKSVDSKSYELELAWTKDCIGEHWCHLGYFNGSAEPLHLKDGLQVQVPLHRGITGHFIDFECGASCDDSQIYWTDAGCHYSISMKSEKEPILIKMANSAIDYGK